MQYSEYFIFSGIKNHVDIKQAPNYDLRINVLTKIVTCSKINSRLYTVHYNTFIYARLYQDYIKKELLKGK